jgi:hypothetical protein
MPHTLFVFTLFSSSPLCRPFGNARAVRARIRVHRGFIFLFKKAEISSSRIAVIPSSTSTKKKELFNKKREIQQKENDCRTHASMLPRGGAMLRTQTERGRSRRFFFFLLVAFQRDRGYAFNASNKERERESDATSPPLFSLSRQTKKREEKMPI